MADVDVSAVVTCVATIITAYNDGLELLDRIKTERAPEQQPGSAQALEDLKSSLTLGPVVIQTQYDNDFRRFGETYAQGDHLAREQLKDIIINLQMTLLTSLRMSLANDRIGIEMDALQTASDNSRVDSSMALCQLYQRLAAAAKSSPMKSPPLTIDRKYSATSKSPPPLISSRSSNNRSRSNSRTNANANANANRGWALFPSSTPTTATSTTIEAAGSSQLSLCSSNSSDTLPLSMSPMISQSSWSPSLSSSPPVSITRQPVSHRRQESTMMRESKDPATSVFQHGRQRSEQGMKMQTPAKYKNFVPSSAAGRDSLEHIHPALRPDRELRMRELQLQLPELTRPPPEMPLPQPTGHGEIQAHLHGSPPTESSIEPIHEEKLNDSTSSIYSRNTDANSSGQSNMSSFRGSVVSVAPMKLYLPNEDNKFGGFCKGAWKLQIGLKKSFQIHKRPAGFYSDILYWRCSKCTYEGPARGGPAKSALTFDETVRVDKATGIRYKWKFLAKSHVQIKKIPKITDGSVGFFGCIFCCAMHNTPALVFNNLTGFMEHLSRQHRQMPPGCEALLQRTGCVVGREAADGEDWEINIV